jgi:hypothetical protein
MVDAGVRDGIGAGADRRSGIIGSRATRIRSGLVAAAESPPPLSDTNTTASGEWRNDWRTPR